MSIPTASFTSTLGDDTLRRIFGNSNNDSTIDGTDFGDFGGAFGGGASLAFDYNQDNTVDGNDFGFFGARFGVTLA